MPSRSPVRVGIAVVVQENHLLVGVRGDDGPLPGLAEFPGGKCHADETPRDAAIRECAEETGLEVVADECLRATTHEYSHAFVELEFWLCRPQATVDITHELRGFRWKPALGLANLQFPEANRAVVAELISRLN